MFGFDKIKDLAKKGVNKVANANFKIRKTESDSEEDPDTLDIEEYSPGSKHPDFEHEIIQENKKLKSLVSILMKEKDQITTELGESTKIVRKLEDKNEDLKVKSLALASQKQILQMKYQEAESSSTPKHKDRLNSTNCEVEEGEQEKTEDLDTLISQLKDSIARYQSENTKLKKEIRNLSENLEAERKIFENKIHKNEDFREEDYIKRAKE